MATKYKARTKSRLTIAEQLVDNLSKAVTTNKALFVAGTIMSEQDFCDIVGITMPTTFNTKTVSKHNLVKVKHQAILNKVLAVRGLCIKSKDYYTEHLVIPKTDVGTRVKAYDNRSANAAEDAEVLANGATKYKCKWRKLGTKQVQTVASRVAARSCRVTL